MATHALALLSDLAAPRATTVVAQTLTAVLDVILHMVLAALLILYHPRHLHRHPQYHLRGHPAYPQERLLADPRLMDPVVAPTDTPVLARRSVTAVPQVVIVALLQHTVELDVTRYTVPARLPVLSRPLHQRLHPLLLLLLLRHQYVPIVSFVHACYAQLLCSELCS
jgi:hypothetical protein